MPYFLLTMWALFSVSTANYPVFEGASQLKRLLIPADVHIGSVVYRLRASDHDHEYPLQFDATGKFFNEITMLLKSCCSRWSSNIHALIPTRC